MIFRRDVLESSRKIRRQKMLKWLLVTFLFFETGALLLGVLSDVSKFAIKRVKITGAEAVSSKEIFALAQKELDGNYFGIYTKKNLFIYPAQTIEQKIYEKFPRVEQVALSISDDELLISFSERKPEFVYCLTGGAEEECFYMDRLGFVFDRAPIFSDEVFFKILAQASLGRSTTTSEATSSKNILGANVFADGFFDKLLNFKDEAELILTRDMKGEKLTISSGKIIALSVKDFDDYEFLVLDERGREWKIMFNVPKEERYVSEKNTGVIKTGTIKSGVDAILVSIARNLSATVSSSAFLNNFKKSSAPEYLDLRFGNKVFYKFR